MCWQAFYMYLHTRAYVAKDTVESVCIGKIIVCSFLSDWARERIFPLFHLLSFQISVAGSLLLIQKYEHQQVESHNRRALKVFGMFISVYVCWFGLLDSMCVCVRAN